MKTNSYLTFIVIYMAITLSLKAQVNSTVFNSPDTNSSSSFTIFNDIYKYPYSLNESPLYNNNMSFPDETFFLVDYSSYLNTIKPHFIYKISDNSIHQQKKMISDFGYTIPQSTFSIQYALWRGFYDYDKKLFYRWNCMP